jgi:hypothetical protein
LIVEDPSGTPDAPTPPPVDKTAGEVLAACVLEAERQAESLRRLDAAMGAALGAGPGTLDPLVLQRIDLLRQEAAALSQVLRLVAEGSSREAVLDGEALAARIPLAEQRARIAS